MSAKLENIWINEFVKEEDVERTIRVDWSNDRHHAVRINQPHGKDEIIEALSRLIYLLAQDPHLKGDV